MPKNKIILIAGIAVLIVVVIVLFSIGKKPSTALAPKLTVWGLDNRDVFEKIITQFKMGYPGAEVNYLQKNSQTYENDLVSALAAGKGPDVFFVSNRSLPKLKDILSPLESPAFTVENFKNTFPTVASQDFISEGKIYAIPLYIDTLALFYNRDAFDKASIPSPPAMWNDFQNTVPKLKMLNDKGQITRAAAAIGGTEKTVSHAVDILSLLMLQNGTQMTGNDFKSATFANGQSGKAALDFYLQFSNPASASYTWNEAQKSSFDSFSAGESAMALGYKSDIETIKRKGPFLSLGVAPVPQVSAGSAVNYASYWGLGVSAQSKQSSGAWDFVGFVTANEAVAKTYSTTTGHPPALRSLISALSNDPELGVFAGQALSARSWYTADYARIEDILNSAIFKIINGQTNSAQALREAQDSVSLLMR